MNALDCKIAEFSVLSDIFIKKYFVIIIRGSHALAASWKISDLNGINYTADSNVRVSRQRVNASPL